MIKIPKHITLDADTFQYVCMELCCDEYVEYLDYLPHLIKSRTPLLYKCLSKCIENNSIIAFEKIMKIFGFSEVSKMNYLKKLNLGALVNCDDIILYIINNYTLHFATLLHILEKFYFNKQLNIIKIIFSKMNIDNKKFVNHFNSFSRYVEKVCANSQIEVLRYIFNELKIYFFLRSVCIELKIHFTPKSKRYIFNDQNDALTRIIKETVHFAYHKQIYNINKNIDIVNFFAQIYGNKKIYDTIAKLVSTITNLNLHMTSISFLCLDDDFCNWIDDNHYSDDHGKMWINIFKGFVCTIVEKTNVISNGKWCSVTKSLIFYWFHFFIGKIFHFNTTIDKNMIATLIDWNELYKHIHGYQTYGSKILRKYFIDLNLVDPNNLIFYDREYYDYLQLVANRSKFINYNKQTRIC